MHAEEVRLRIEGVSYMFDLHQENPNVPLQ
jgi:hypothetical protein